VPFLKKQNNKNHLCGSAVNKIAHQKAPGAKYSQEYVEKNQV